MITAWMLYAIVVGLLLAAGGLALETMFGLPLWWGVTILAVFAGAYTGVLSPIPHEVPPGHYLLLGLVAVVFLALSYFQTVLTGGPAAPWLLRLYVHLYNGLYTDLPVERMVYRVWPARFRDLPGRRGRLRS